MAHYETTLKLLGKPVDVRYDVEDYGSEGSDVFVTGINIGGHWFDTVEVLAPYIIDDLQAQLQPALAAEANEALIERWAA